MHQVEIYTSGQNLTSKLLLIYRILILIILNVGLVCNAQTYIKINAATALVLIPNIGIETSISEKMTFQVDINASFWKSINNNPFQFVIVTPEIRYHFREKFNGFYAGANISGAKFKINKYQFLELNNYQEGYSYMIGATIGYQKKISEKFVLDVFIGGGSVQSFYKGYYGNTNIRYETATNFNKSGEFIPYRGGIMLSYKI